MTNIIKDVEAAAEGAASAGMGIQTKLIIILGGMVLAGLLAAGFAHHFEAKGAAIERAGWLAKQVKEQQDDAALVAKHAADMRALEAQHQLIERQTSEKHEQELAQLRHDRDADRAAVDRTGGLRIVAPACPAGRAEPATAAAGTGGRNESGPATVRLPEQVENDLWNLADDADEVSAQLRACQGWIRSNGFYGTSDDSNGVLLGKIAARQNSEEATP